MELVRQASSARAASRSGQRTPFLPPLMAGFRLVTSAASAWCGVHSTAAPPVYSHARHASSATGRPRLAAVSVVTSTDVSCPPPAPSCSQQWSSETCMRAAARSACCGKRWLSAWHRLYTVVTTPAQSSWRFTPGGGPPGSSAAAKLVTCCSKGGAARV